jgi:hypothetical protein
MKTRSIQAILTSKASKYYLPTHVLGFLDSKIGWLEKDN